MKWRLLPTRLTRGPELATHKINIKGPLISCRRIRPAQRAVVFLISLGLGIAAARADEPGSLTDNMRRTVDFSSRLLHAENRTWQLLAIGLDVHSVIAGTRGDIGTLTLQPYLLRVEGAPVGGGLFHDGHDWALQWRIANFNYTGLGHGRFNIRMGHFEIPFGLEQIEQTNGRSTR